MADTASSVVALAGGVGGSKLVAGLAGVLDPDELTVVVNTADDFEHLGLWITPDLDTVLYRLAGVHDPDLGWGRADATWEVMDALADLGGPDWFRLGDQDLATSLLRTHWRRAGVAPSTIVERLADRFGVATRLVPMTDGRVATRVHTAAGEDLAFQEWFVARRCEPAVARLEFRGAEEAAPSPGVIDALASADLVVLAPSNPFLSIDPILAVPGVRDAVAGRAGPTVAITPIVGGRALKGPAARLLDDFGLDVSVVGVATHLRDVVDAMVVDAVDATVADDVAALGLATSVADTVMDDDGAARRLAAHVLDTWLPAGMPR